VNWKNEGAEIKNFADPKSGKTYSRPQNTEFYFQPGVTYPFRSSKGFSCGALRAGAIFALQGSSIFESPENLKKCLVFFNSDEVRGLLFLITSANAWQTGYISIIPYNIIFNNSYENDLINALNYIDSAYETKNYFIIRRENDVKKYIKIIADLHKNNFGAVIFDNIESLNQFKDSHAKIVDELYSEPFSYGESYISICIGCCFGRFDIRIACNPSLTPSLPDPFDPLPVCPPAMLVGTDGLPARPENIASEAWLRARPNAITLPPEPFRSQKITASEYPLEIPWDGILVDDPEDSRDIISRLRAVLTYLHGTNADAKERELCSELAVRDLREYLRKPSLFFNAHLKRYSKSRRKAPIYWPLQTRDGRYTLWLYYPRLTADTLYGCINILEAKIRLEQRKLELARIDLEKSEGKAERTRVEELTEFIAALTEMKEELERVAALPYKPNLDDGVQITAAPLWRLFRLTSLQKELKVTWEKLENGDYDWAHLAYSIWPDRVREKCRNDRSLAIAHGLENICEQKPLTDKDEKKKRGRKAKPAFEPDEELEYDED